MAACLPDGIIMWPLGSSLLLLLLLLQHLGSLRQGSTMEECPGNLLPIQCEAPDHTEVGQC